MKYKSGYKYQLAEEITFTLKHVHFDGIAQNDHIRLEGNELILRIYYASDGPSGPTRDTKNFMRGAFMHDGGYQLIREGLIPETYRILFDKELRDMCREDGMTWVRAQIVYTGVRLGGKKSATKGKTKPVLEAP